MANVVLRAMEPEDLDLLYQIENDIKLWNIGLTNVPYSRYVLHDYIATSSGDIYTDKQVRLIIENEERQTIGLVDIMNFNPQNRRAEMGIVVQEAFRQKGYGKDAIQKVMRYAKEVLHLHQLYVVVNSSQKPTIRLFLRMGFKETCQLTDWLYDGEVYHDATLLQCCLSSENK
ncbi:GNAT family N-acetyltransferase [Hoylesella timonensis]|uniref:Acetyltransferase, GNAT family n=1 Tax=Hoylesella timonensis CRIS 5C-B1 TaxID=679189 RepID=D1VYQ8_9BACT|nr:GNAT family N-acetyltransferase [Hoylesella timonensis]EFA97753.1 acetyltransferase, GNAT family [Hoylesella timonensis CRIS 5C-B1]